MGSLLLLRARISIGRPRQRRLANQRAKISALEREAEGRKRDGPLRAQDHIPRVVVGERRLVSSPLAFLPTPSSSGPHATWGELIPSDSETLKARIELQSEGIRAHELAVEERRRSEHLRAQRRQRDPRSKLFQGREGHIDQHRSLSHQREEQRQDELLRERLLCEAEDGKKAAALARRTQAELVR